MYSTKEILRNLLSASSFCSIKHPVLLQLWLQYAPSIAMQRSNINTAKTSRKPWHRSYALSHPPHRI